MSAVSFETTTISLSNMISDSFEIKNSLCLSRNLIRDQGVLDLCKSIHQTQIIALWLGSNHMTDIGAKALIQALKNSSLIFVSILGNSEVSPELESELSSLVRFKSSVWYKTIMILCSVRFVNRLGKNSYIRLLSPDIFRQIAEMLPVEL
jgi:hypothetical protein